MARSYWDQYTGEETEAQTPQPAEEPNASFMERASDLGIDVVKGAIGLPESYVGLGDLVTGGRLGKFLKEYAKYDPGLAKEILSDYYSEERKLEQKDVSAAFDRSFFQGLKEAVAQPATFIGTTVESLPQMIGGGALARGALKVSPKLVAKYGDKAARLVASGVGEGAMAAGSAAEGIRQQSETGTITGEQALYAAGSGALTGAINIAGSKLAGWMGIEDIDLLAAGGRTTKKAADKATKSRLMKFMAGMVQEGAFEELPQSTQEQIMQNLATGKPWSEGVSEAAGMGMLAGAAMGGPVGALSTDQRIIDPNAVEPRGTRDKDLLNEQDEYRDLDQTLTEEGVLEPEELARLQQIEGTEQPTQALETALNPPQPQEAAPQPEQLMAPDEQAPVEPQPVAAPEGQAPVEQEPVRQLSTADTALLTDAGFSPEQIASPQNITDQEIDAAARGFAMDEQGQLVPADSDFVTQRKAQLVAENEDLKRRMTEIDALSDEEFATMGQMFMPEGMQAETVSDAKKALNQLMKKNIAKEGRLDRQNRRYERMNAEVTPVLTEEQTETPPPQEAAPVEPIQEPSPQQVEEKTTEVPNATQEGQVQQGGQQQRQETNERGQAAETGRGNRAQQGGQEQEGQKRQTKLEALTEQARQYDGKMLSRERFVEDNAREPVELVQQAADEVYGTEAVRSVKERARIGRQNKRFKNRSIQARTNSKGGTDIIERSANTGKVLRVLQRDVPASIEVQDAIDQAYATYAPRNAAEQARFDQTMAELDQQAAERAPKLRPTDFKKAPDFQDSGEYVATTDTGEEVRIFRDTEQFSYPVWYEIYDNGEIEQRGFTKNEAVRNINARLSAAPAEAAQTAEAPVEEPPPAPPENAVKDQSRAEKIREALRSKVKGDRAALIDQLYEVNPQSNILERLAVAIKNLFGRDVIYVSAPEELSIEGLELGGSIIINTDFGSVTAARVIGHELMHSLETRNPAMYRQFKHLMLRLMKNKPEYQNRLNELYRRAGLEELNVRDATNEMLADLLGEMMLDRNGTFWDTVADFSTSRQQMNVLRWVATELRGILGKIRAYLTERSKTDPVRSGFLKNYVADLKAAEEMLARFLAAHADNRIVSQPEAETGPRVQTAVREQGTGGRMTKAGKYVGAPTGINSKRKVSGLRTRLFNMALKGQPGRYWYERSGRAIREYFNGDVESADKFTQLLAVYSANRSVASNTTLALKAYYQWLDGKQIRVGSEKQDQKATAILVNGTEFEGIKTSTFYTNLMIEVDPGRFATDVFNHGATIDMWMMRAMGYDTDTPTDAQYAFAEEQVAEITKRLQKRIPGITVPQAQAMVWTAAKAESDKAKAKARAKETGKPVLSDEAYLEAAKYDYMDGLQERRAQVSWEAEPGASTGVLPGIYDAPMSQKEMYLERVIEALTNENGKDVIAERLNLLGDKTLAGSSAWMGEIGAGAQTFIPIDFRKSDTKEPIPPRTRAKLDVYAAIKGLLLNQEAVAWHVPVYDRAVTKHNGVHVEFNRRLDPKEMKQVYDKIIELSGTQELAPAFTETGITVLNFTNEVQNKTFHGIMANVFKDKGIKFLLDARNADVKSIESFRSVGDYISNNWKESPNGEEYRRRIESYARETGQPDLPTWINDQLAPRIEEINRNASNEFGWGQPTRLSVGEGAVAAEAGDQGTVRLVHYSRQEGLTQLEPSKYGTGLAGAEAKRKRNNPQNWVDRTYFGFAEGPDAYRKEPGLGGNAYEVEVDLGALYDYAGDPDGLRQQAVDWGQFDQTKYEKLISDAGYEGYFVNDPQLGMVAAKFTPTAIPQTRLSVNLGGLDETRRQRILAASAGSNLAAAADAAREVRRTDEERGFQAEQRLVAQERKLLKRWAEWRGQLEDSAPLMERYREQGELGGAEHLVFLDEPSQRVVKMGYGALMVGTYLDYLERLQLHNYVFPETAYELRGFTEYTDYMGESALWPVVTQRVVNFTPDMTPQPEVLTSFMAAKGFVATDALTPIERPQYAQYLSYEFINLEDGIVIGDLHQANLVNLVDPLGQDNVWTAIDAFIAPAVPNNAFLTPEAEQQLETAMETGPEEISQFTEEEIDTAIAEMLPMGERQYAQAMRFSVKEDATPSRRERVLQFWEQRVDDQLNAFGENEELPKRRLDVMGSVGVYVKALGEMANKPFSMPQGIFKKLVGLAPTSSGDIRELPPQVLERLPRLIADPGMIVKSREKHVVLVSDEAFEEPLFLIVKFDGDVKGENMNAITSLYEKDNIDKWALGWNEDNLVYENESHPASRRVRELLSLQTPSGEQQGVSAATVSQPTPSVNPRFAVAPPVESEAFQRWFGDSQMVDDATGEPKVMYHKTNKDFNAFRRGWRGAIFVTENRDWANAWTTDSDILYPHTFDGGETRRGDNVLPVYVKAENPFDYENADHREQVRQAMGKNKQAYMFKDDKVAQGNWHAIEQREVMRGIKDAGFDSFYVFEGIKNLGVFDPTQIKSATGNVGTYDAANPDIRTSVREMPGYEDITDDQAAAIEKGFAGFAPRNQQPRDVRNVLKRFMMMNVQGIVDQYRPIKEFSVRAWKMARMTKAAASSFAASYMFGELVMREDGSLGLDAQSKGLAEIFSQLPNGEVDRFLQWRAGHRAYELRNDPAGDREKLFTDQEIDALKQLNAGTTADGRNRRQLYRQVNREFNKFKYSIIRIGVQSGIISENMARDWIDDYFVPFYRALEEQPDANRGPSTASGLVRQQAFKKLKGSQSKLNDLLENTLLNFNHLIKASMQNMAGLETLEAAVEAGIATEITSKEAQGNPKAVYVRRNGQPSYYEVEDDLVMTAITSVYSASKSLGWLMKLGSGSKRLFTFGVTSRPGFMIANLFRDTIAAIGTTGVSVNPFKNLKDGFATVMRDNQLRRNLQAGGGSMQFTYNFADDMKQARREIRRLGGQPVLDSNGRLSSEFKNAMGRWADMTLGNYLRLGNKMENINRAAIYKQALSEGRTEFDALFEAADLLDFRQMGSFGAVQALVKVVPFINARIQGLDKLVRAGKAKEQRTQLLATVGMYSMAAIALWLANRDDDDWEKLPEHAKDNYLWFKIPGSDYHWTLPIPFEIGGIGTLAWRGAEAIFDETSRDGLFLERLRDTLLNTFSLNPVPQAVKPVAEVATNTNWFTETDIEPSSLEAMPKSERARPETTVIAEYSSRIIENMLGEGNTFSPVQIDHLIKGYFGWVGDMTVKGTDALIYPALGRGERPETPWYRMPVARTFIHKSDPFITKYAELFYESMRKANEAKRSFDFNANIGRVDRAMENEFERIAGADVYREFSMAIAQLRMEIVRTKYDTEMGAREKRLRIEELQKQINELHQAGYETYPLD